MHTLDLEQQRYDSMLPHDNSFIADAIEEISPKPIEAIRATGASFMNVVLFGVLPQVISRFVGFATYQLDSNLRNSTMVGIVGAGGIGGVLFAAFLRYEYNFVCTILAAVIIIIVTGLSLAFGDTSGGFRRLVQIVFGLSIAFAASSFFLSFFSFGGGALV